MHDIPDGETWAGSPAMPIKQAARQAVALQKLPDLRICRRYSYDTFNIEKNEERRKLSQVFANSSDGIFSVDDRGCISSWNPAMATAMERWGRYELGRELSLPMRDREIVIGRSSDLDMVLVEDMVSRKHDKIFTDDEDLLPP